jgi:hypothetical protein
VPLRLPPDWTRARFEVLKHCDGAKRFGTQPLPMEDFLPRLLLHVPGPGQRVVRSYGLYHHHTRAALERCRGQLPPPVRRRPRTAKTTPKPRAENRRRVCGRPVLRRWRLPRTSIPPPHPGLETVA